MKNTQHRKISSTNKTPTTLGPRFVHHSNSKQVLFIQLSHGIDTHLLAFMPKGGIKITSSVLNKLVKTEDLHLNHRIIIYRPLHVIAVTLLRPLQLRGHSGKWLYCQKSSQEQVSCPTQFKSFVLAQKWL